MFANCRHCNALVATDPATDLPPERCPRCGGAMRGAGASGVAATAADETRAATAAAATSAPGEAASAAAASAPAPAVDSAPAATAASVPAAAAPAPEAGPAPAPGAGSPPIHVLEPAASAVPVEATQPAASAPPDGVPGPPPAPPVDVEPDPGIDVREAPVAVVANADVPPCAPAAGAAPAPPDPAEAATPHAAADTPPSTPAGTGTGTTVLAGDDAPEPPIAVAAPPSPPAATSTTQPGFLARTAASALPAGAAGRWGPPAAIVALVVLLGLQVVLADRDRLATDPQWRPLAAAMCGVFGCSLPPWRETGALVLLAREVRPHPGVDGALRVRASFRNDARWAQAWPQLVLTLSDVDGRAVAARAFEAGEYLVAADAPPLFEPGQTVDISLDIQEPSVATVSFAFDFR